VVLTGGFSKAYSSLLAFVACPPELKRLLKVTAPPYLYSGPSPVASLASVLVGLQVSEARGDDLRAVLWARTRRVLDHLEKLGAFTLNRSGFPIVEVPLADPGDLATAGRFLLERGIYVTLAFYPGVPREEVGFRIQVTRGQHRRAGQRAAGRPRPVGRRDPAAARIGGTPPPRLRPGRPEGPAGATPGPGPWPCGWPGGRRCRPR
jgi:7-keto-8-aminopelargonate synthetase-like enzyme